MRTKYVENEYYLPEVAGYIREGHTVTMQIRGFSMRPFIQNGRDKVVLAPFKEIRVYDVVLAHITGKIYVLHRVIKKEGELLTLKGDGNVYGTESCTVSDVLAKAVAFKRKGREREERTDGTKWKVYSFVWLHLTFMRRYLLAFDRLVWQRLFN